MPANAELLPRLWRRWVRGGFTVSTVTTGNPALGYTKKLPNNEKITQ